jgi:hypothetical protein
VLSGATPTTTRQEVIYGHEAQSVKCGLRLGAWKLLRAAANAASPGDHPDVSRAFPSWNRSMLTEIYLCHACSYHRN